MRSSCVAVAVLLSFLPLPASGTDRFVRRGGTDSENNCTAAANPCRTLEHALTVAGDGDTVKLAEGVYKTSLLFDQPIAVTIEGGWNPTGDLLVLPGGGGVLNDLGGNLSVNPQLAGHRLTSNSPLIDAGTCVSAPSVDFDGDPRPSGAACDIGADEFVP